MFSNKELRRLIVPIIVDTTLFMMVGFADTLMVASLGDAAVSGVSLIDMITVLTGNVLYALATGGAVIASQLIGAKKLIPAHDAGKQLLFVAFAAGIFISTILLCFDESILFLLFGELAPDVKTSALQYLRITAFSQPFGALAIAAGALFRTMNHARYIMYSGFLTNVLNISGNAIFIYALGMGVRGVAFATLIARIVNSLYLFFRLTNPKLPLSYSFRERPRITFLMIRRILYIGIPSGIENGVFQFGRLITTGIIASFGTVEIAANALANSCSAVGVIFGSSFSMAMLTVVGQCVGAAQKNHDETMKEVRLYIWKLMRWLYIGHIPLNFLLILLWPLVTPLLKDISAETLHLTRSLILIHCGIGAFLWPLSFTFPNALRASNDVVFSMASSIGSMALIRVGLSYWLAMRWHIGVLGVWWAMVADWGVRIACFLWRYHSNAWVPLALSPHRPHNAKRSLALPHSRPR